jgi:signal transduction histidine kinase/CheY-like chemotaxis protein
MASWQPERHQMGPLNNMRLKFLGTLTPLVAGSTIIISMAAVLAVYQSARIAGIAVVTQESTSFTAIQQMITRDFEKQLRVYASLIQAGQRPVPGPSESLVLIDGPTQSAWDRYGETTPDRVALSAIRLKPNEPNTPVVQWSSKETSLWLTGAVKLADGRALVATRQLDEALPRILHELGRAEFVLLNQDGEQIISTWRNTAGLQVPPLASELDAVSSLAPGMLRSGGADFVVPEYRGFQYNNQLYNADESQVQVFYAALPIIDPHSKQIAAYGVWALPADVYLTGPKWLVFGAILLCSTVVVVSTTVITRVTNRQLGSLNALKEKTHALVDAFEEELPTEARYGPITDHGHTEVTGILRAIDRLEEMVERRNKLENDLHQAQKMESIGRLAGGIAHDFNNLLTVIVANCELLLDEQSASSKRVLNEVIKAGRRAETLTRQLLAFSRRQVLDMKKVDLNEAIGEIDDLLRRLVGARMRFSIGIQPNIGLVHADPGQLHQVIMNLCVNARDASKSGGRIELSVRNVNIKAGQVVGRPKDAEDVPPGEYVRIAVNDFGAGMSEEVSQQIFEPFFTTKPVSQGTGLGLSVVKGIVEQSAGYTGIHSVIDEGTTIAIYLPKVEGVAARSFDHPPARPIPEGTGTLLLVEDEDLVRSAISRILRRAGYTVHVASNPISALHLSEEHAGEIELVLTDVIMPDMTGIELMAKIRETQPDIATLFMSGYPGDEIARHGSFEEHNRLIQKPVSPSELVSHIRSTLSDRSAS